MKKIYILVIFSILFSCTVEPQPVASTVNTFKPKVVEPVLPTISFPNNSENPYDYVGDVYIALFDTYFESNFSSGTFSEVIERVSVIASNESAFMSIVNHDYFNISTARLTSILSHPTTCVSDVVNARFSSVDARSKHTTFITTLLSLYGCGADELALYGFIVAYEHQIVEDPILSAGDKTKILISTAIMRQAAVRPKKKPKKNTDPDWDLMVGNVVGAVDGSAEGVGEAITWALAVGISQNLRELED